MGTLAEVTVHRLDRKLTDNEVLKVVETFKEIGWASGHPLAPLGSYEAVKRTIRLANDNGYLEAYALDDHVVGVLMFDVAKPWWSDEFCLKEMLVLTIDPEFYGFGRIALARLQELAKEYDCALIESASAFNLDHKLVGNLYMRKGKYDLSYPNFVKKIR